MERNDAVIVGAGQAGVPLARLSGPILGPAGDRMVPALRVPAVSDF
jgi:hypothetical protein